MSTATKKPLSISRILIGQPYIIEQPDAIMIPAIDVRVIAENGAMFKRAFLAFGLTDERIRRAWETEPEKFLKIDFNHPKQLKTPITHD